MRLMRIYKRKRKKSDMPDLVVDTVLNHINHPRSNTGRHKALRY